MNMAWSKKPDDLRFCTVGLKEVKFWNPADSSKRLSVKGTFGTKAKITYFSCATFDVEGTAYTAGANGQIYLWDTNSQLDRVLKAHTAEVTALIHENGKLISGGKDNKLVIYKAHGGEYTMEKTIDLDGSYPKAIDYFNGKVLLGLRNGNIYEVNESTEDKKLLMASHHEGEAWGLEVIPE
jgi:WD40 repeat protein